MKLPELKYWITPEGEIIKIADAKVYEHFKYFNNAEKGREFKKKYGIKARIKPETLYLILNEGFIRVLDVNEILNISYKAVSLENPVPICVKAVNGLLSFFLNDNIKDVQYDYYVDNKSNYGLLSRKEFVSMLSMVERVSQELVNRILKK